MSQLTPLIESARDCGLMAPGELWDAVANAHATPGRHYHNLVHVAELCDWFGQVARGPGWQNPREVLLAIAFHDSVYVAGQSDNEARSAALAARYIARWLSGAQGPVVDVARIEALIGLTAHHGGDSHGVSDSDTAHFLDADMAILAASPERFAQYDRQIASEYADCVPPDVYRRGRARFFRRLLGREHIYHSEFFHQRCESAARRNLSAALPTM